MAHHSCERSARALARWALCVVLAAPVVARALDVQAAEPSPPVRIALRAEVEVTGRQVRLGDVAVIETLDLATLERLVSLPIGPAPRTGTTIRLRRDPLLRWIRARTGLRADRIAWVGAGDVAVRAAASTVSGGVIVRRATEALDEAVARSGLRAERHAPQVPRDVEVPAGSVELRPRSVPRAAVLSRRPSVWVDLLVEGRFVRTVPVSFDLTVYGPGLVATDRRLPGDALDRSAVEVREVPWSGLDVLPVDSGSTALRLRRPVEPGVTLTRSHVEPAPLVHRGSWVTLRSGNGLVSLESRAEVLEDGRPGQTVRVRPPSSDGPILARVTGPGAVEVVP